MNAAEVVSFWLGDAAHDPHAVRQAARRWYHSDPELDAEISDRFGALHAAASADALDGWLADPIGALAVVILLDQFTRNLYRGTADAWAEDPRALRVASATVDAGLDRALPVFGSVFLYHPFHHAESLTAQDRAVLLFEQLHADAGAAWQPVLESFVTSARSHRDTIARFGRFPHRNHTLGRTPTPAEAAWLEQDQRRYGQ